MSKEGNSKAIIYGVAAVGALIGGAILFNYISGKSSSSTSSAAFDEIEALGPAKKEPNGLLTFPYYKDVFLIITKHSKLRFAQEKKDLTGKRRTDLKAGNNLEYKEVVQEMIQKEEAVFGDLLQEAMDHIGLTE
jgi:hypothetical protein